MVAFAFAFGAATGAAFAPTPAAITDPVASKRSIAVAVLTCGSVTAAADVLETGVTALATAEPFVAAGAALGAAAAVAAMDEAGALEVGATPSPLTNSAALLAGGGLSGWSFVEGAGFSIGGAALTAGLAGLAAGPDAEDVEGARTGGEAALISGLLGLPVGVCADVADEPDIRGGASAALGVESVALTVVTVRLADMVCSVQIKRRETK